MQPPEETQDGAEDPTPYGFKRITLANWKRMDEIIQFPSPVTEEHWVKACLTTQMGSSVPEEIAALFEVARGSMIYGWFFYPVISLATEQCFRVLEAGARARCDQLGLATQRKKKNGEASEIGFSALINALEKAGHIDQPMRQKWDAILFLRNDACHPKRQTILPPGDALKTLAVTADFLNRLFPSPKAPPAPSPNSFPA